MQRMLIQLWKNAAASPSDILAAAVSPPGNDSGISRKKINRQPRFQFGAACFLWSLRYAYLSSAIDKLEFAGMPRREWACSFRPRSGITALIDLRNVSVVQISSRFDNMNLCKSGFADGMSKPIPYGCIPTNSILPAKTALAAYLGRVSRGTWCSPWDSSSYSMPWACSSSQNAL